MTETIVVVIVYILFIAAIFALLFKLVIEPAAWRLCRASLTQMYVRHGYSNVAAKAEAQTTLNELWKVLW